MLRRLRHGKLTLDERRRILADVLQGERVIVGWTGKRPSKSKKTFVHNDVTCTITLPAFGALPSLTVNVNDSVAEQVLGASLDVHMIMYDAECAEDVAI